MYKINVHHIDKIIKLFAISLTDWSNVKLWVSKVTCACIGILRGFATYLGWGDEDRRGRARYKAQNPLTPKISFLLEFHPLYFGDIEKIKRKKKVKNDPNRLRAPDPLSLWLRWWGTISEDSSSVSSSPGLKAAAHWPRMPVGICGVAWFWFCHRAG